MCDSTSQPKTKVWVKFPFKLYMFKSSSAEQMCRPVVRECPATHTESCISNTHTWTSVSPKWLRISRSPAFYQVNKEGICNIYIDIYLSHFAQEFPVKPKEPESMRQSPVLLTVHCQKHTRH